MYDCEAIIFNKYEMTETPLDNVQFRLLAG